MHYKDWEKTWDRCKSYIESILYEFEIDTCKYFVIANDNDDDYNLAIQKYSKKLNNIESATPDYGNGFDFFGKCLEGTNQKGEFCQAIIIKLVIMVAFCVDHSVKNGKITIDNDYEDLKDIGYSIVTHELGHAYDNQNIYNLFGIEPFKIKNYKINEYKKFIRNMALYIWGEYYAENFMYIFIKKNDEIVIQKESMLLDSIHKYPRGKDTNSINKRVYRICYFYAHYMAYYEHQSKDCPLFDKYNEDKVLLSYKPYLKSLGQTLHMLKGRYPEWENKKEINNLKELIYNMIQFEHGFLHSEG